MISDLPSRIESSEGALDAEQVSKFIGISDKTVYQMAKQKRLPSYRWGSSVRFDPKEIADWVRGNKQ